MVLNQIESETLLNFIELMTITGLWVLCMLRKKDRDISENCFVLGLFCFLLSDVYWCVMLVLFDSTTYYFSATDMCTIGGLGLWASFFKTRRLQLKQENVKEKSLVISLMIFSVLSMFLWVYWNGLWITDIVEGIAFAVFTYEMGRELEIQEAFRPVEKKVMIALLHCEGLFQVLVTFVPEPYYSMGCYIAYFIFFALFLLAFFAAVREKEKRMVLAMAVVFVARYALTLSSDFFYLIMLVLVIFSYIFATYAFLCEKDNNGSGRI